MANDGKYNVHMQALSNFSTECCGHTKKDSADKH